MTPLVIIQLHPSIPLKGIQCDHFLLYDWDEYNSASLISYVRGCSDKCAYLTELPTGLPCTPCTMKGLHWKSADHAGDQGQCKSQHFRLHCRDDRARLVKTECHCQPLNVFCWWQSSNRDEISTEFELVIRGANCNILFWKIVMVGFY